MKEVKFWFPIDSKRGSQMKQSKDFLKDKENVGLVVHYTSLKDRNVENNFSVWIDLVKLFNQQPLKLLTTNPELWSHVSMFIRFNSQTLLSYTTKAWNVEKITFSLV